MLAANVYHQDELRGAKEVITSFRASTDADEESAVRIYPGGAMKNLDSLMAAYLAVWAIFFVYHYTVARLQDEITRLKQSLKQ